MMLKDAIYAGLATSERGLIRTGLLSPNRYRLPDFLGLGGPQCGSTWLHQCLSLHPEVWMPANKKEIHYFDQQLHQPLFWYQRFFRDAGDRVAGEITPGYSVLREDRIRYVRRLMPDLRMVYVIRNPIDRIWSVARRRGVADGELVEFVKTQPAKDDETYGTLMDRGEYLKNIRRWASVFPPERLHVALFDDIVDDPQGLLQGVFRHIGVDPDIPLDDFPLGQKINPNPPKPMPDDVRATLAEMYQGAIEKLAADVDSRCARWLP